MQYRVNPRNLLYCHPLIHNQTKASALRKRAAISEVRGKFNPVARPSMDIFFTCLTKNIEQLFFIKITVFINKVS